MTRSYKYSERDYSFGQTMITLRVTLDMTQVDLAAFLACRVAPCRDGKAGSAIPSRSISSNSLNCASSVPLFMAGVKRKRSTRSGRPRSRKYALTKPGYTPS